MQQEVEFVPILILECAAPGKQPTNVDVQLEVLVLSTVVPELGQLLSGRAIGVLLLLDGSRLSSLDGFFVVFLPLLIAGFVIVPLVVLCVARHTVDFFHYPLVQPNLIKGLRCDIVVVFIARESLQNVFKNLIFLLTRRLGLFTKTWRKLFVVLFIALYWNVEEWRTVIDWHVFKLGRKLVELKLLVFADSLCPFLE